jgi:hypothetical protein
MLIGSKLPPDRVDTTYFNSGRAAFAFLLGEVVRPRKVYLPAFTCWSLVSTMERRFPELQTEFYPVGRDLSCRYPARVERDELLVFIHYFGHENQSPLPPSEGCLLEDLSHSKYSGIRTRGDHVFGSFRKIVKVGDGGFLEGFHNPVYEPSRKLETWLRYEAKDWKDIREAENMVDRDWQITDISSQSLAILLAANEDLIRRKRQANEAFLVANIKAGRPLLTYRPRECPLLHNRILGSREERDSLRAFLARKSIFTSIHWPTHEMVRRSGTDIEDTLWLEEHILSIPVSHDYNTNDMERIADAVQEWRRTN